MVIFSPMRPTEDFMKTEETSLAAPWIFLVPYCQEVVGVHLDEGTNRMLIIVVKINRLIFPGASNQLISSQSIPSMLTVNLLVSTVVFRPGQEHEIAGIIFKVATDYFGLRSKLLLKAP
jgi:hypothetical protein